VRAAAVGAAETAQVGEVHEGPDRWPGRRAGAGRVGGGSIDRAAANG
jgi:hypothetical protein